MIRASLLLLVVLSGCTNIQYQGASFDRVDQHHIPTYGQTDTVYFNRYRSPVDAAGALNFTWTFDWPLGSKLPGER